LAFPLARTGAENVRGSVLVDALDRVGLSTITSPVAEAEALPCALALTRFDFGSGY
jgi:hypothetical protein